MLKSLFIETPENARICASPWFSRGPFTGSKDSFPCPLFSLEVEPVQMLEPKGRREEWPEKNASVSMTLGPSPEDAGRVGSLHLYPLEGELGPYWGERPSES